MRLINLKFLKMEFFRRKYLNVLITLICVLLVCHVHSFPWPRNTHLRNMNHSNRNTEEESKTPTKIVEYFDSKRLIVNANSSVEDSALISDQKPTDQSKRAESGRQLSIPFMAVPANWVATFEPTNAVILTNKVPLRIWAIGNVAKFPNFLEKIVQRVQSFYSTYKYQDLSRPASHAIINPQYHQHEIGSGETTGSAETTDTIDNDPVTFDDDNGGESTEIDTETSTPDYYDSTTEFSYIDQDDSQYTESYIEVV